MVKLYAQMTAEEQLDYLERLTEFAGNGLPRLTAQGCSWDAEAKASFEVGLELLDAHPQFYSFCLDSRTFKDYARRIELMQMYIDSIKEELARIVGITAVGNQMLAYVQTRQETRRRGRPSREEMLREAAENANGGTVDQQAALTEAVAALVGATVVQSRAERELNNEELAEQRKEKKAKAEEGQMDLFAEMAAMSPDGDGSKGSKASEDAGSKSSRGSSSGQSGDSGQSGNNTSAEDVALLPLRQIAHLLKPNEVGMISDMKEAYNTLTVNSETAKAMAEQGAKSADIAPYTNAAHTAAERIGNLKHQLDIAMRYALYHSPKQLTEAELATLKAAEARLKDEGNTDTNETNKSAEETEAEKELKKRIASILKYLRRTDKPNTEARIKGMEKKMQELKSLIGEKEIEKYLPLLEDAKKNMVKSV